MAKKIDINNLDVAVADLLRGYGDLVYQATEEGLNAAEKVLIKNLKAASPKGPSGDYQKSWKGKGEKYALRRYVGNTKRVMGKEGEISLSNILEYSKKSPHQGLIKRIYESSISEMAEAVIAEIKKEA